MAKKQDSLELTETIKFDDAPHFSDLEFARIGCLKSDCCSASLRRLERLREVVNEPLILTSAYRTPAHERANGRSGKSAHTLGCAFDISCTTDALRYKIVTAAIKVGFNRIGIGKNFVHVDDSNVHTQMRIWTYYK